MRNLAMDVGLSVMLMAGIALAYWLLVLVAFVLDLVF